MGNVCGCLRGTRTDTENEQGTRTDTENEQDTFGDLTTYSREDSERESFCNFATYSREDSERESFCNFAETLGDLDETFGDFATSSDEDYMPDDLPGSRLPDTLGDLDETFDDFASRRRSDVRARLFSVIFDEATSGTVTETSSNVLDIIQGIKLKVKAIQAVGACFNPETSEFDITFVSKQPNEVRSRIEKMMSERSSELPGYNLEVRNVSEEGIHVTQSNEFIGFFNEDGFSREIFELQEVISKLSDTILKRSPNITSVSFSPVRSTGYGTSSHVILKEACIVIFVKVKFDNKRIPLGTKRIPKFLYGIKTDIREGFVETLMQAPENALNVGSGCLISRSNVGTLGPFICTQSGRTGFLTSLHVLLSSKEIKDATIMSPDRSEVCDKSVYKANGQNHEIGKLTTVYFSRGDYSKSGYEFGLIELSSNVAVVDDIIQTSGLAGYKGETAAITQQNYRTLLEKLGAKTGLTQGFFAGLHSFQLEYDETRSFDLLRQIGLLGAQYERDNDGNFISTDFAKRGDSGALVTIKEGDTHKVVGILTGRRSDNIYIATPIQPICDCLQIDGWKICAPQNHNNNCEQRMDINPSQSIQE